ncbi:hypothetical protein [Mesorhizobium sp. WSM4906]|uniref:hypothetical protein n=1 Tax=Mesorhizobium sp. WSM4906 TaxID=3038546 RepID=UPI002416223C|nr:hypothetical protein [Mesorhizobium sp. WSM4906]WFP75508.1 hypothetical protein QAZ22_27980 [Mesorhizobium sp. WSM4906]
MNNGYWEGLEPTSMLVGVISNTSATTALCFDGLSGIDPKISFRFIDPYKRDASEMDDCDVLIFVRHLFMPAYKEAFVQAKRRGKLMYLLVDDNFVTLAGERQANPIDEEIFKPYGQPIFKETLEEMDGVLCASAALTEFFQSYHHTILPFGAVSDRTIKPIRSTPTDDVRIGFFGGGFRIEALKEQVLPALKNVAERQPVTLFAGPNVEKFREQIEGAGIRFVTVPLRSNFREFVAEWQSLGLQVAVHPKGETKNVKYKTANAVLVSHYLGAVPLLSDEPAYASIGKAQGVLKIGRNTKNFSTALASIETASQRDILLARMARFCETNFDPMANIETIRKLRCNGWAEDIAVFTRSLG